MTAETATGSVLVLGARNLGGAILGHLIARGWTGAAVARSEDSLAGVRARGGVPIRADAAAPDELDRAVAEARRELGRLDLIVNAVSAARRPPGEPFGGGPLVEASLDGFRGWSTAVAEQSFVFLSRGARALRESGGGSLVQVTGGSARRAIPGKGPWAAGSFAARALVQAAAQELREHGVHVALLVVDATIESPKTADMTRDTPRLALARQEDVAEAVEFLALQGARGMTHELVITPAGDRWVP